MSLTILRRQLRLWFSCKISDDSERVPVKALMSCPVQPCRVTVPPPTTVRFSGPQSLPETVVRNQIFPMFAIKQIKYVHTQTVVTFADAADSLAAKDFPLPGYTANLDLRKLNRLLVEKLPLAVDQEMLKASLGIHTLSSGAAAPVHVDMKTFMTKSKPGVKTVMITFPYGSLYALEVASKHPILVFPDVPESQQSVCLITAEALVQELRCDEMLKSMKEAKKALASAKAVGDGNDDDGRTISPMQHRMCPP